mgnify:CR=1 FL=1
MVAKPKPVVASRTITTVKANGWVQWQVGKTYAVQPARTKPQVAHIRITGIRQEIAQSISVYDAIAEGWSTPREFLQSFTSIHSNDKLNAPVWVIEFELVSKTNF